jgi:hypothetical protein
MIDEKIRLYLEPNLGQCKKGYGQIRFCCPICDKGRKFNLEICVNEKSHRYKLANCWGCSLKGNIRTLLKSYATDESWRQDPDFKINFEDSYSFEKNEKQAEVEFPDGTMPYFLKKEVKEYLTIERGISEKVLHERNIMYCFAKDDKLYNHIIFPFYSNGKLIGYTTQNFETKKYKNFMKLDFIAYDEFINWEYPIVLTEGIYDCLSVPNAIPLLGINLSKTLLKKLKDKKIILAVDNNTEVPMELKIKMINKIKEWSAEVTTIFDLGEYKDLNDFHQKDSVGLQQAMFILFQLLNFIK